MSAPAGGAPGGASDADAQGGLDLVNQNNAADAANPGSVGVKTPTTLGRLMQVGSMGAYDPTGGVDSSSKPTKFGALMKFLAPIMEGGLVGLAGGKGHPQGGFGAANEHFQQKRALTMQQIMLQRQLQDSAYKNSLEAARTNHLLQQPNFNGRGVAPIKGRDAQGNLVYMRPNPQTGQYELITGITPDEADDSKLQMTDQGLVSVDPRNATARPVMLPRTPPGGSTASGDDSSDSDEDSIASTQFNSGSPRLPLKPGVGSQSPDGIKAVASQRAMPLRPPNYGTPKPTIRASRNSAGVESDNLFDTNPNSPTFGKQIGSTGNTRAPLPDRTGNRFANREDQKNADLEDSEKYAAAALSRTGNDPDKAISYLNGLKISDPDAAANFNRLLPSIRKSISDRTKQRKPKAKNPLGLSDQDWQSLVGGSPQQSASDNDE